MSAGAGLARCIAGVALCFLFGFVRQLNCDAFAFRLFTGFGLNAGLFFRFLAGDLGETFGFGAFCCLFCEALLTLPFLFLLADFAGFQNFLAFFLAGDHSWIVSARACLEAGEQRLLRFNGRIPALVEVFFPINCHLWCLSCSHSAPLTYSETAIFQAAIGFFTSQILSNVTGCDRLGHPLQRAQAVPISH